MSVLNENTIIGASAAGGDYEIEQSLRFDDGRESYLSRTPSVAGNRKTWTWSAWVKRGNLGFVQSLFSTTRDGSALADITFRADDKIDFMDYVSGYRYRLITTQLFRDVSSWYHLVAVSDTSNATSSNRVSLYVNGEKITAFDTATYPTLNLDGDFNDSNEHRIAREARYSSYLDGYMGEVNFIDGQALTPDNFGETGDYGEWKPTKYAGTYGTNGFYLPFEQDYAVEGFSTVVYEGNSSTNHYIGGTGFSPDMVWIKSRSQGTTNYTGHHYIFDTVRGASKFVRPNSTAVETTDATYHKSFNTDGFTLGNKNNTNYNGDNFVAWNWDMGGTTASNTSGSITSSVRANPTYGQSIVSYSGTGSAATVGHGLAYAPTMIIIKKLNVATSWMVYNAAIGNNRFLYLDNTNGQTGTSADYWNNTTPSSSVISLGNYHRNNSASEPYIAYCFHDVANYSKFGSYSGSGSSGNAITTGFAPAFVMVKRTDAVGSWVMWDNVRDPNNPNQYPLYANLSNAETLELTDRNVQLNSNGFTLLDGNNDSNASGGTYIYAAFADTREYAYWYDQSGNNNDWTSEGGLTESDVMVDSPTNNFCTFNSLNRGYGLGALSQGNLNIYYSTAGSALTLGTLAPNSGKWYCEFTYIHGNAASDRTAVGIGNANENVRSSGNAGKTFMATTVGTGLNRVWLTDNVESDNNFPARPTGTIIQFAWDMDAGKAWMGTNNQWSNSSGGNISISDVVAGNNATVTDSGFSHLTPLSRLGAGGSLTNTHLLNCGQDSSFAGNKTPQGNQDANGIGDFYYAPPAGFLALCTSNLPDVDVIPSEHFNTVLYTGTRQNKVITGVGFQPDFAWFKTRSSTSNHVLIDSVRGGSKALQSSTTSYENQYGTADDKVTAFSSDGYSLGVDAAGYGLNNDNVTTVAWNWKAGGSASSNTNGTITSQVSANPSAGFSIVSYTGTGANATVGHGLSVAPEMVIIKERSGAGSWRTYSKTLGGTKFLSLDQTTAESTATSIFNDTDPTSTVFSLGSSGSTNESTATYIAYAFHSVDGYSKVGSFDGNGSETTGPFVHCGFKPKFVLVRRATEVGSWFMFDTDRSPYNVMNAKLSAENSGAEDSDTSWNIDFLSNGFKLRSPHIYMNSAGNTHIFIAFAESPFKHTNAR